MHPPAVRRGACRAFDVASGGAGVVRCHASIWYSAAMMKNLLMALLPCVLGAGALLLSACGTEPAAVVTCNAGCDCIGVNRCECGADGDCEAMCEGDCVFTCRSDVKCDLKPSDGAFDLTCLDDADCKANGGDDSRAVCRNTSDCDIKAGANSSATCEDTASCKFNLGAGSTAVCADASECDIKCTENCMVECAANASCQVNCGPDDSTAMAGVECSDGRVLCGGSC